MRGDRTKEKGSLGELRTMYEAAKRGFNVLIPQGDHCRYDLVIERDGKFERVQVKAVTPKDGKLEVHLKSMTFSKDIEGNNRNKMTKYVEGDFDWVVVYDLTNHDIYYLPASKVQGMTAIALRLEPTQRNLKNTHMASDYTMW